MKTLKLNERGCEINSDRQGEGKERQRGYELDRETGREDVTWIAGTYDQTRGGRRKKKSIHRLVLQRLLDYKIFIIRIIN